MRTATNAPPRREDPPRYRDRVTGELLTERVFGGSALHRLYGPLRPLTDHVLTTRLANHLYGLRQRSARSRARIAEFVASLGIDANEAEKPLDAYRSLDEFFARRLKPDARPIDRTSTHLCSPADGRALAFDRLDGACLRVKGCSITLRELLRHDALSARFADATALVVRLAPADYHRFHFPCAGVASVSHLIDGPLHSVHPIALEACAPSFANKRMVSLLETELFGPLVLVEVGALLVGTIVQTYTPGPVERGDEKGYFRFGGSTVVLIADRRRVRFDDDLLETAEAGLESQVRMGTRVGSVR